MIAALAAAAALATASPYARPPIPPRDAVRFGVEAQATPDGYVASFWSAVGGFTVDPAKVHVDLADARGALRASDVARDADAPEIRRGPPGPAETARVTVRLSPALLRPGMQTLLFRLDRGAVTRGGVPVDVASMAATQSVHVYLPDETHDAALQRAYAGAPVHTYGSMALRCDLRTVPFATVHTRPHADLRAVTVRRMRGAAALLRAGSSQFAGGDYAYAYKAIDPLEVAFDTAHQPVFAGSSFVIPSPPRTPAPLGASQVQTPTPRAVGPRATPTPDPDRLAALAVTGTVIREIANDRCRALVAQFADAWDLERALAPGPAAAGAGNVVRIGMTHEQVAEVIGFPSVYATKAELLRMPEWRYVMPAPFSSVVTFDGDRVVKYQPPGNLP